MTNSPVLKPSVMSVASVDPLTIIEAAHDNGTSAVIRSPHFDRLTSLVSLRGLIEGWFQRTVTTKDIKKRLLGK